MKGEGLTLQKELEEALNGLPTTASGVADYLIDLGVRGVPEYQCACPVARWIRQLLDVPLATADADYITVYSDEIVRVPTPDNLLFFFYDFDTGTYPDLIDDNGPTDEERWQEDHSEPVGSDCN